LVDASDRAEEDSAFPRVMRALELLSKHDPKRYMRMQRDLDRIIVFTAAGPEYWPELNACILNRRLVDQESAIGLAVAIVHEATHARLWQGGHRYRKDMRARVEKICTRAEVSFLRTMPGTEELRALVIKRGESGWWTEEAMTERYTRKLKSVGAPIWFIRLFQTLRRLRSGSQ
jgi:hypothetical protein